MAQSRTAHPKKVVMRVAKRKRAEEEQAVRSGDHHIHKAIFAAPCCSQCGRQLHGVPFALANIVCRDCYGMDRYAPTSIPGTLPGKPLENNVTDETARPDETLNAE
jgi:hypothetical protein